MKVIFPCGGRLLRLSDTGSLTVNVHQPSHAAVSCEPTWSQKKDRPEKSGPSHKEDTCPPVGAHPDAKAVPTRGSASGLTKVHALLLTRLKDRTAGHGGNWGKPD